MIHYRYEADIIYSEYGPPEIKIKLIEFDSVKETPCGYWIVRKAGLHLYKLGRSYIKAKFVLKDSRKRYAYPTIDEALNSFRIRCKKRIAYLKRDLNNAELIYKKIKDID